MALFSESKIRARADRNTITRSVGTVLNEKLQSATQTAQFDIFLSHSFSDQKLILGVWLSLEDLGYKVYVDWINDRELSRTSVTKETARVLRARMLTCKSLLYATTANSSSSKWMPWELGFKDGHNRKAAILPVTSGSGDSYAGQEYLGIYPYVTENGTAQQPHVNKLWIHTSATCYVLFDLWLTGSEPIQR